MGAYSNIFPLLIWDHFRTYQNQLVLVRQFHWWANFVVWHRDVVFAFCDNRKVHGVVETWKVSHFGDSNHLHFVPNIGTNQYAGKKKLIWFCWIKSNIWFKKIVKKCIGIVKTTGNKYWPIFHGIKKKIDIYFNNTQCATLSNK